MLMLPNSTNNEEFLPLVYRHPLNNLITALPYIEEENIKDERIANLAYQMIENELKTFKKKDYLENLQIPNMKFIFSEEFDSEIEKIKLRSNEKITKKYDVDLNDVEKAKENAEKLAEYNINKVYNFELLQKFGPEIWKKELENNEIILKRLEEEKKKLNFDINEINSQRKYIQFEANDKLEDLKQKIRLSVEKNRILEQECDILKDEIYGMQRKKMKLN